MLIHLYSFLILIVSCHRTPCLRNGHINVCRSCQDIGTLCDLPPVASAYRHRGTSTRLPSLRTKQLPLQQEQRPAPKSLSQQLPPPAPPFPADMLEVHPTRHQTRSHAPIPSSSSSRFKSSMRVIQISEEDDKYKLPKASLPAPPPDAPAFSPRFTAAAHPFGISPPPIPIPFTPGVHPPVFKPRSRAASPVVNTSMSVLPIGTSRSHSIAHVHRYEDWPKESRSGSSNYTDPFLLPPIQNVPYQNRSPRTDILHRSSHRDQEQRQQQEVRALEHRPPIVPTPLLQDQPYHTKFPATVLQRGSESRRAYLTDVLHKDPNSDVHERWFGGISTLNKPSYTAEEGNKPRHSTSPDEALSPEDLRGTSAKRTRVTEGYWAPRRPQSACESCRAKK